MISRSNPGRGGGNDNLFCCFVDFRKAFDTVPQAVLWQVLEDLGVSRRVLTVIQSMYAQDSAAVHTSAGLSEVQMPARGKSGVSPQSYPVWIVS